MMERDKTVPGKKKSSQGVCNEVSKKYKTSLCARSVQHYNNNYIAGESPKRRGPDGEIDDNVFKLLIKAYKSYVRIEQINSETADNKHKLLSKCVNNTMKSDSNSDCLLQRLQRNSTIDFAAKVSHPMEERHLHWTTYSNLNCWFDNWENFLVNYGFGTHQKDRTVHVPEHQKP